MSLFPRCEFQVLFLHGGLYAGRRNEGQVVLTLPEPIARAEHLDLLFRSTVQAGYGEGKGHRVVSRCLLTAPLRHDLIQGGLHRGRHEFPFVLDLPSWLPAHYQGADCSIKHVIDLRLDVDWALDPTAAFATSVIPQLSTVNAVGGRIATRSPKYFDEEVALEITMDSRVIVRGEPLTGQVALRSGHNVRFDAVVLSLLHCATVRIGDGDDRTHPIWEIRVSGDDLRAGRNVAFQFRTDNLPVTQQNGFLDLSSRLRVILERSWWKDSRSFDLPLEVLVEGSSLERADAGGVVAVGGTRLGIIANEVARVTGLRAGRAPAIVEGEEGMVRLFVEDASRGSDLAAREIHTFPDLALGMRSRPLGILPAGASLAPEALDNSFAIKCDRAGELQEAARQLIARVLDGVTPGDHFELSDHHLSFRRPMPADDVSDWLRVVDHARARARRIADAIGQMPFKHELAREAWTSAAFRERAFLVPHVPSLGPVRRAVRTSGGEERALQCTLTTLDEDGEESTRLDIDLDTPLPPEAIASLHVENPDDLTRSLRAIFSLTGAPTPKSLTAIAPGFASDPRILIDALDIVLAWTLHARGERAVDAPYR